MKIEFEYNTDTDIAVVKVDGEVIQYYDETSRRMVKDVKNFVYLAHDTRGYQDYFQRQKPSVNGNPKAVLPTGWLGSGDKRS